MNNDICELNDAELDATTGGWGHLFNETETLQTSVLKKRDDAANAVIQKM